MKYYLYWLLISFLNGLQFPLSLVNSNLGRYQEFMKKKKSCTKSHFEWTCFCHLFTVVGVGKIFLGFNKETFTNALVLLLNFSSINTSFCFKVYGDYSAIYNFISTFTYIIRRIWRTIPILMENG